MTSGSESDSGAAEVEGLSDVDHQTLLPIVRLATGRPGLEIGEWSEQALHGGAGRSPGIRRISGEAYDRDDTVSWSLVLKLLGREEGTESPSSWNYWRREADAYESGFLDTLPGRLRAPRCFASHQFEPGLLGLWLEDVHDVPAEWSMAHFTAAASSLGELSGTYAANRLVPDLPWLSRSWLRQYVEYSAPMIDLLQRSADDPWVRRLFPPEELQTIVDVWEEREWCLDVLARLPQTLCHLDAFSRNLMRCSEPDGEYRTVAIDWAFVGRGAVGEELAPLVVASVGLGDVDIDAAADLEQTVLDGYLDGLARSGFECDERLVRLGYAVAATLRYSIGPLEVLVPTLLDRERHAWMERAFGMPMSDICEHLLANRRTTLGPLLGAAHDIERDLGLLAP